MDSSAEQPPDYRLIQRRFYCHNCNKYFKKLMSQSDEPECPTCNDRFVEELNPENEEHLQMIKQAGEKEVSAQELKERDHEAGYRMVFNSPTMQQQYHTRINVNGGEAAPIPPPPVPPVARPSVPPSHPPPNSFVQFTSTSVNGQPMQQQVFFGQPPSFPFGAPGAGLPGMPDISGFFGAGMPAGGGAPGAPAAGARPPHSSGMPGMPAGFFNIFDMMNQMFAPPAPPAPQGPRPAGGMPGGAGFPFMGGMGNFFQAMQMPDFTQFMGFNPHNFQQNYGQNFRSSGDFMTDLATYLSQLDEQNHSHPTSKTTLDKLPEVKISEQHCKKDGQKLQKPSCTICVEEFSLGEKGCLLPCGHIFHRDCVLPWLQQHNTCPVCRFELPSQS